MEGWALWEKIVCTAIWALVALFFVAGAMGGLVYLIKEVIIKGMIR